MVRIVLYLSLTLFACAFGASTEGSFNPLRPWWNARRRASSGGRIVGGFEVAVEDIPFQVSLSHDDFEHFCGGSLLSERWVLTAGHCASPWQGKLQVRCGSSRHASGGQVVTVKKVHRHPKYDAIAIDYDYSLLELEEAVIFTNSCSPVGLPQKDAPQWDHSEKRRSKPLRAVR
ncbi:trypsin 5G1-like [Aedes albopictus]|uniref:trypsin n=1 Tax=Aedes albopictus TaxID=7160 RepID=A0ABM1ZAY0_AEDAL